MTGLLEEAKLSTVATSRWIRQGLSVYPTIKFHCDGWIRGISGIAYFEALERRNYYYNRTLVLNLQVWRLNQFESYYAPTGINSNAVFTPEKVASGSNSLIAPFYFSNSLDSNFSIDLGDASIEVMAGDILGISLPQSTPYGSNTQINGIPIMVADNFTSSYFTGHSNCWSPTQGATLCNPILTSFTPLLALKITPTSMPTGKHAVLL